MTKTALPYVLELTASEARKLTALLGNLVNDAPAGELAGIYDALVDDAGVMVDDDGDCAALAHITASA